jgi:hypothetical protein
MMMEHLEAYTAAPVAERLTELLAELDADPALPFDGLIFTE